jgi:glucose-1-phosphate cytidylyltransferase
MADQNIPVVILCGGMGTRLREETEFKPKPMVEIGGRPLLWHIMKLYAHHGFRRFILCLGYRGSVIKDYFANYEARSNDFTVHLGRCNGMRYQSHHTEQDFEVTLVDTGLKSMTGERIKRVESLIDTDMFMVTYGDGLADLDISELVRFHRSHGALATLTASRPPSRFGVLELASDGQVVRFGEKAQAEWINGGFFVFNRRVLDYLDEHSVLEQGPLQRLAADRQLRARCHDGFWIGMDTYREYELLNQLWDSEKAPWKLWS